MNGKILVG
jgi:WD40 repeat protein